jgi:iron complex transport system ATP-binding protein
VVVINNIQHIILAKKLITGYGEGNRFIQVPNFPLNLEAKPSELIALIGTNGSGKTTLLKTLAGLHPYKSGELEICGLSPIHNPHREFAKQLSIGTTEPVRIAFTSVYDFVSMGRFPYTNLFGKLTPHDTNIVNQSIHETGLDLKRNALLNNLSDGERQRAVIARTLTQDTPLILFDEPTAYLDIPNKFEILNMLKSLTTKFNKTILFSTHDLTAALHLADKIWLITSKEIIQKIPEQLIFDGDLSTEFNSSHIHFDTETINFIFKKEAFHEIGIQGNGLIRQLTEKALKRIGFEVSSNKSVKINVIIKTDNNSIKWELENKDSLIIFNQLEELILHLKQICYD